MKTRQLAACALALAALQAGCNDLLTENVRSQITTDTFFRTASDANAALAGVYEPLASGNLFDTDLQWALNASDDATRVGAEEENANITAISRVAWDARNPYVTNPYAALYRVITRANLALERVPGIEMDAAARDQILAQAKFLRALGYFYLVRLYGDVPLVVTSEEQLGGGQTRAPKADVYAQVIKDATEAEAGLPATWPANQRGRATKGSANALIADYHIWRSSAEGQNEWAAAAAAAKKVVDSGVHSLVPNYLNAFLPGSQNRPEEVFAVQSSTIANGPEIDIAQWTRPRAMDPNGSGGWATYTPLPWFVDSYPAGDYRREVTYFTSGRRADGTAVTFATHIDKYRPTAKPGNEDVNYPIYRYADVLLMYAEALNEQGQTAAATQLVNQVRARARNADGAARAQPADLPVQSQAATREAIFQERQWELAHEGKRWFDMVRRGQAYFLASLAKDPTATDVQATDMLWPIPQTQRDLNSQLTQNPGY
jgi:hypothetical protein